MAQVTQSDYRTAQNGDAGVRQEFVDAIDLGEGKEFLTEVRYVPEDDIAYGVFGAIQYSYMSFEKANFIDLFKSNKVGHFNVHPYAFEMGFIDFMNALMVHEMTHARQIESRRIFHALEPLAYACGLFRKYSNYIYDLEEIPAYTNQLDFNNEFRLTALARKDAKEGVKNVMRSAKTKAKILGRDWKKDLSGILCPSPNDDFVRARYGID